MIIVVYKSVLWYIGPQVYDKYVLKFNRKPCLFCYYGTMKKIQARHYFTEKNQVRFCAA